MRGGKGEREREREREREKKRSVVSQLRVQPTIHQNPNCRTGPDAQHTRADGFTTTPTHPAGG
ncbi:uncharacterized protein BDZ83DRAFT_607159 [Colletotrichum acutatum]|uniref:Uncharacterized protein n=1 Tax=Glomerella acutata TaxID=27357 RepID=A0AAD8XKW8_GLOAC|nr:uncharacterized protein BDZ83DRAFT_607159 [Colletotrichum acutatum]KAK1729214.1 hypothetical protein BDZ83DRAFT_607159 [Colletotrichum acutatum]